MEIRNHFNVNETKHVESLDFRSADDIYKALISDDEQILASLQEYWKIDREQLNYYIDFAKLREQSHVQQRMDLENRIAVNPNPTEEELRMGAFYESLEPQVRHAVAVLRAKGYSTNSSGFWGPGNTQKISFEEPVLDVRVFSVDLKHTLESQGIEIELSPTAIVLQCKRVITLDKLKDIWDAVAEFLPDLGYEAPATQQPLAQDFRHKFTS